MKRIGLVMIMGVMVLSCQREEAGVKPILYSPMERAAVYHPTFVWESIGDMYHLQVSADSSFASTVINEEELTDTTYTPEDTLEEARYYWRVRAKLDTWGEWSDIGSFFVVESPPSLISPPDADTVKFPTLIWSTTEHADGYRLFIYQGVIAAGRLVLDANLTDTSYTITDTLAPATYRWGINAFMDEEETPYPEIRRFVTYTLDESFFPVGPNYVWEYMHRSWHWYGTSVGDPDTSFFTTEVVEFISYGDSIYVTVNRGWDDIGSSFLYKNDSICHHYSEWEGLHAVRLFPSNGEPIGDWNSPVIKMESDSSFWIGYKPIGGSFFGEDDWWYMYRQKGKGLTYFRTGWEVRYHGDPTQNQGWDYIDTLINLNKGE
ncbi:MAG: hypothetical protein U9Q76_03860 [candidate division WOR-3 bacterium]|nr:hypothetical protein [candidate division WOR-3 bacterium]